MLGFEAVDPGRYGRLVVRGDTLDRIVEYKDADEATRAIALCNSGVMAADAGLLRNLVGRLGNDNAAGEYYLTDVVSVLRQAGHGFGRGPDGAALLGGAAGVDEEGPGRPHDEADVHPLGLGHRDVHAVADRFELTQAELHRANLPRGARAARW